MTQDEKLTNIAQLKYIVNYIQRKTAKAKEAYDNSKSYKRIALAKKLKKVQENEKSVLQSYQNLKKEYGYL